VYRRRLQAVRDPIQYFCFITFFPHMVAGPIMCAKNLLHQFGEDRRFDWSEAAEGCRMMLWGFFKKMVIADTLAGIVNTSYGDVSAASGWALLWATYAFAFQIYCDFSGYTDIAIGCARLFGIHLMRNFAYPYFAQDIREFWRRWHISLSSWFRDYVYIPLGGSRVGGARTYLNIMIVFVVSGFWHGANWTFLIPPWPLFPALADAFSALRSR
jgi:alginate O-acetyltransferase complex protein AlgI